MSDELDAELRAVVLANWGMVYDLHRRAEEVRSQVLKLSYEGIGATEVRPQYERRVGELYLELTKAYWYVGLKHQGQLLSYVQVEVRTQTPKLEARVYTAFVGKGVTYAKVKACLSPEVRSKQLGALNTSGGTVTTVERYVPLGAGGLEGLGTGVVEEVQRQLEVALELYEYVVSQRAGS